MRESRRNAVMALLDGRGIGQPLVDLGGRVASLSTPAYLDLKAYLGYGRELEGETITLLNTIGTLDERVLNRCSIPFRRLYLKPPHTFRLDVQDDGSFHDEWGVRFVPKGPYNERVGHPLADATLADLDRFAWPEPTDPGRVKMLSEEARRLHEETDYALVAGHLSAGLLQDCWNLRGMARFLRDMILDRAFAEAMLDRVTAIHIGMWERFLDAVGDYIVMVETADDLAGQASLLISPQLYRHLIKPRQAAMYAAIRRRTKAKILFHSCGAVAPLIDDLIEIGVDVLNPIQPLPGLMDAEDLAAKWGDSLIFHGGLDVQRLLLSGNPGDVREHVFRYLDAFGPGRYIMAPANSVQPGTPPQNLLAAYDAAQEYAP